MSSAGDPVQPLKRIEAWLATRHPDRLPLLRHGADPLDLRRAETRLGQALPADLRRLYAAHDGQPEGAPSLYLNQRWLPLDLVAVAWEDLRLRHGARSARPVISDRSGGAAVLQAETWSESWLPLFGNWRGDHYCVDLHPDHCGRVVWFLYDQPHRAVVANSLTYMLARVADGLETGRWHLDPGLDGLSD